MNRLFSFPTLIAILFGLPGLCFSETETATLECRKSSTFLAPIDSPDYRRYAPDREVEVLHLALDVTPDFQKRTVEGKAIWIFKPIAKPLTEITLDAVDLSIH